MFSSIRRFKTEGGAIIKRVCAFLLAGLIFCFNAAPAFAENKPRISAQRAVLIHESGKVLYEKNADERSLIASTTKLMTAIVVLENSDTDDIVKIEPEYCNIEGSSMYLKAGEEYTVKELLEGLLLVSGNDAAKALACHTAKTEEEFAALMNKKAAELGMENSHFQNPHGLDSERHYSTANDLAKLMAYCMKNPDFREITAMRTAKTDDRTMFNHNKLLKICKGCKGGKTGYTMAAGRCLVSCCERQGTSYICVTLSAPDDWNDHIKLYNWAFSNYAEINAADGIEYSVPLISGEREKALIAAEDFKVLLPTDTKISVKAELPFFVFAPVSAGERAGKIKIYAAGELLGEAELYYKENVRAAA